jgi:hypothetical protein
MATLYAQAIDLLQTPVSKRDSVMKTLMGMVAWLLMSPICLADQNLIASRVDQLPVIDGIGDETAWQQAKAVQTFDSVAQLELEIRAVYNDDSIAIMIAFDDEDENRVHKPLLWDDAAGIYKAGPQREDTIVIKWNMNLLPTDLRLNSDRPYKADIWYWKSYRTDHAGHADDKYHNYSKYQHGDRNKRMVSNNGQIFYFSRYSDSGQSAYQSLVPTAYAGDRIEGFELRKPEGSRADIQAKGQWKNKRWTVEFGRKLKTGHDDDVQLSAEIQTLLGISRFELAGRNADAKIQQPNFGSGEITELLTLFFAP